MWCGPPEEDPREQFAGALLGDLSIRATGDAHHGIATDVLEHVFRPLLDEVWATEPSEDPYDHAETAVIRLRAR